MSYQFIRCSQTADGIVTVWISDPPNKNAVNFVMNRELAEELLRVEQDDAARVLILTGEGAIFCSGGNIKQMSAQGKSLECPGATLREDLYPHDADIRRVVLGLRRLSKPTIAAINGPAIGSGLGLAAGCDIRIAAHGARFGWVFTRRGMLPDDGSLPLLPQIIGYAKAFQWGITGRTLTSDEALGIGFVSETVEPHDLLDTCYRLAKEIIEHCPPVTARLFKLALGHSLEQSVEESIAFTAHAQQIARQTADHTEALKAFAEKRPPVWQGR